jgi:hypothetical protein
MGERFRMLGWMMLMRCMHVIARLEAMEEKCQEHRGIGLFITRPLSWTRCTLGAAVQLEDESSEE